MRFALLVRPVGLLVIIGALSMGVIACGGSEESPVPAW